MNISTKRNSFVVKSYPVDDFPTLPDVEGK